MTSSRLTRYMIPLIAAVFMLTGSAAAAVFRQPVSPPPPPPPEEEEYEAPDPAEFEGYWECSIYQYSGSGNPDENWGFEFLLGLFGDEEFEAEGSYYSQSLGYYEPFHAFGDWWLDEVEDSLWLRLDGTAQLPDFSGPFIFVGENTDWWTLEYEYVTADIGATISNYCRAVE